MDRSPKSASRHETFVDEELMRLSAELDATIAVTEAGETSYRFDVIPLQLRAGERLRNALTLDEQEIGRIVYSSADDANQADRRALESFDRELTAPARLSAGSSDGAIGQLLSPYAADSGRVAFVDDFELVAFDEELRRTRAGRR